VLRINSSSDQETSMRRVVFLTTILSIAIFGCGNPKKPSDSNFTKAINKQLAVHGKACVNFRANSFPIDIPKSQEASHNEDALRMAAFESAGVVKSSEATAMPQNSFAREPISVKRYDLTESGKKYLEQIPGAFGTFSALCYARENVDSIVKWNEPETTGGFSMTIVTYTYRLANVADWAKDDRVVALYPEIKREFDGEKTQQRAIGLQLTNKGWDAN
jgi:hypothetical protein